ncbi:SRPBCC family protein [Litorihabitans aurantiacus]|nr:SRPBCC family protein [Litorihabitans aurantiacus]
MRSIHVSRVVAASAEEVYAVASDPDRLPAWASGLASADVVREGDLLHVASPMGKVTVRFVSRNDLGVLDHDVTLPDGTVVTNPMRVVAHPDGAEVLFTVRQLAMSDAELERDAGVVAADLERLAALVERRA